LLIDGRLKGVFVLLSILFVGWGGAGAARGGGGRHLGDQSAAVHRHSLDRLNTIFFDFFKESLIVFILSRT